MRINGNENVTKIKIKFDKTIAVVVKYAKDFWSANTYIFYGDAVKEGKHETLFHTRKKSYSIGIGRNDAYVCGSYDTECC